VNAGDDAATVTMVGEAVPPRSEPPHTRPPAVVAAEEVAEACWRLADVLAATRMPPELVHQVAGRLLGAADALGVVVRLATDDPAGGEETAPGTDSPWKAADQGLAAMFRHLYLSIPGDHPARQWFIRYAKQD
jgi:hypothetical protein